MRSRDKLTKSQFLCYAVGEAAIGRDVKTYRKKPVEIRAMQYKAGQFGRSQFLIEGDDASDMCGAVHTVVLR